MAIDAKKTLAKLRGEDVPRGPVSVYLDKELLKEFKRACGDVPYSRVMEEMMREFVVSANTPTAKKPAK